MQRIFIDNHDRILYYSNPACLLYTSRPTTGFRYEVLTDDPAVRKQVDEMIFDFYGEEVPCRQEDHEPRPEQGMTFGGM